MIFLPPIVYASNHFVPAPPASPSVRLANELVWTVGDPTLSTDQFGLGPKGYAKYTADPVYVIGKSTAQDWPYVLPGPSDGWAGSQAHSDTILFGLSSVPSGAAASLELDLADTHSGNPPVIEVSVNGKSLAPWQTPAGGGDSSIYGDLSQAKPAAHRFNIPADLLRPGLNEVQIENQNGSWVLFKAIQFSSSVPMALKPLEQGLLSHAEPSRQAILRVGKGEAQQSRWSVTNIGPTFSGFAQLLVKNRPVIQVPVTIKHGANELTFNISPVARPAATQFRLVQGRSILKESVAETILQPVRRWTIYLMPHAHLDVGYTNLQAQVSQIQQRNLLDAAHLYQASKSLLPGNPYRFNFEGAWVLDQFRKDHSPSQIAQIGHQIHDHIIYPSAGFANELTGLMRDEEMMAFYRVSHQIISGFKGNSKVLSQTDVPGITWGSVTAMAENGVKAVMLMPNPADRLGDVIRDWQDRPFWWVGPDGKSKVLVWETVTYGMAHGIRPFNGDRSKMFTSAHPDERFVGNYLWGRLSQLTAENYPYSCLAIPWSMTDNSPVDGDVPQAVADWNKRYASPKIVLSTFESAVDGFLAEYKTKIPSHSGDLSPYWEDGAGSSAHETAENRLSADRLSQATAAASIAIGQHHNPASWSGFNALVDEAWKNVLLYTEHTWGAYNSISEPNSEFVQKQWATKKGFADSASKQSQSALHWALSLTQNSSTGHRQLVAITNTQGFAFGGVVTIPRNLSSAGDIAEDVAEDVTTGRKLVTQRLRSGDLAVEVPPVPPLGRSLIAIKSGPPMAHSFMLPSPLTLSNGLVNVRIDQDSGLIRHLTVQGSGQDFVPANTNGLNQYRYFLGPKQTEGDPVKVKDIQWVDFGNLVRTVAINGTAPGTNGIRELVTLTKGSSAVLITNILEKTPVLEKESGHFSFPFSVPNGQMRIRLPWAIVRPEKDQLPGANRNWLTAERYVDVSNSTCGISLTPVDAPLIEVGSVTANILSGGYQSSDWIHHLPQTQTVLSWAFNNQWYTNYRADQEGELVFRYSIHPHLSPFTGTAEEQASLKVQQPLLVSASGGDSAAPIAQLSLNGAILTTVKPAAEAKDPSETILRFFGAANHGSRIQIRWSNPRCHPFVVKNGRWRRATGSDLEVRSRGSLTVLMAPGESSSLTVHQ